MPVARKTFAVRAVALALAALLAAGAELLLIGSTPGGGEEFVEAWFGADGFRRSEYLEVGENSYRALARDACFLCDGIGGVPVRTLDVSMRREAFDETETVLYYAGVKDGIEGEFIAALASAGDGVYTADIDAERVDSVRIYPTERLGSTVEFFGITLNPPLPPEHFSAGRALFFALALGAAVNAVFVVVSLVKKNRRPFWTEGYWICSGLVAAVGYQATRMFTATRGMQDILVPCIFAAFSVFYLLLWLIIKRIGTVERKLAVIVCVVGCLFALGTAPLQVPDEYTHFLRAWSISQGRLGFDGQETFPDSVELLVDFFPGEFYSRLQQTGEATAVSRIAGYLDACASGAQPAERHETKIQLVLPYIPAALAVALTRLFTGNALLCLYAARLVNVAIFAACAYAALRWAKRYRGMLILFALMPLTLFMAASVSYDSMLLAAVLLYFGVIFKEDVSGRDIVVMAAAFGVIIMIKPIYLPLALAVFSIPADRVTGKRPRVGIFAFTVAVGLFALAAALLYAGLFAKNIEPVAAPAGTNVSAQIMYVLANPARYLMVMLVDGYMNGFYLGEYGRFGWLDVSCVLTGLLSVAVAAVVAGMYSDDARLQKRSDVRIFSAISLVCYATVVTGFYCTWSTLGSTSILGVQARYFLPVLPVMTAVLAKLMSRLIRGTRNELKRDVGCVYLCGLFAALSAAELAVQYYLT